MTIRVKIILITVFGLLLTVLVFGFFSITQAENILKKNSYDSLISKRDSKLQQLSSYFDERIVDMKALVNGLDIRDITIELISIHEKLDKSDNKASHAQDVNAKDVVSYHEEFFTSYIKAYGYYNILLLDKDEGHIVYAAVKDVDYAQNTSLKELKNSSLHRLWKKVLKLKRPVFSDLVPYGSGNNDRAMFLGAPVYVNGEFKSIIVFHISDHDINDIMKFREGYKGTQEDYLVGEDYLMRSESYLDGAYHSANTSLANVNGSVVNTIASRKALSGESGIEMMDDYRGSRVLSAYAPLRIGEDLVWAIISEIDEKELMTPVENIRNKMIIISLVLLVFMSAFMYIIVDRSIIIPLKNFQEGLDNFFRFLNRDSRRVPPLYEKSNDEIGDMARAVNKNIIKTKNMIAKERELSEHDRELTEDLKKAIKENKKHAWVEDGIGLLHKQLSGDLNTTDVSKTYITHVCNYLHAGVGVLYVFDSDAKLLTKSASFAHKQQEGSLGVFKLGEGTVGQVALQKSPMLLKGSSKNDLILQSGTSSEQLLNIYTFALIFKGELFGVVEVGSNELFDDKHKEFLDSSALVVAASLASSFHTQKVQDLLEDAKFANNKLQQQQQKLEETNSYMEEQQQLLEESNAKMEEHRVQLEEQNDALIQSQNMLDQKARDLTLSNKYKSEFLANMSHELRTPLNSIILLSDILQENQNKHLDDDEIKKARIINSSGNDLLKLIGDVLDLSKIEAGMMDLIIDKTDSSVLCQEFQDQFEDMAKQKELEFKTIDEYKGEILNDRDRLYQVLRNLISNAIKFTHNGSIVMKIQNSGERDVKISISDTGIGIPNDKIETIFEAFKQADGTTSREYGGTGLGLSISLELIKMMRGDIYLESKENEGSIFSVIIPNIDENTCNIAEGSLKEAGTDVDDDRSVMKSDDKAFLIIEDDKVFSTILKDKINIEDEYALIASNAKSGLSLAKKYDVKGILLDLCLPDMDGIDVLKELKTDRALRDIPVYVISGDKRVELTKEYGAEGFALKPLTDEKISNIIEEVKGLSEEIDVFVNRVNKSKTEKDKAVLNLKGKKVLVVDDDVRNIYVLLEALSSRGAEVITASNGKEAVETLKDNLDTNIVLMDIMMPVMDGYEATKIIKKNKNTKEIPVIAVTAKAMNDDRDKALEAGCDDYIAKPLQMSILSTIIEAWIKK